MLQSKSHPPRAGHRRLPDQRRGRGALALMHNLKHNKVLHEQIFIVTVHTADTPRADPDKALVMERLSDEITKVS